MAGGERQQEKFRQAVTACQWQRVRRLVLKGCSLQQRELAVSQAVKHSQWWLVSQLVQLGVSQQHRDLAVHKAVRYCLWGMVEDLVSAGVSSEKRDFLLQRAVRQRQWGLVSRLLTLGSGPELRPLVLTQALEQAQWGVVLEAVRLGLKQELVVNVFEEVVRQQQWEHVPSLVKLCPNPERTDFVLQAAIRCCEWGCVRQLVQTGLTPTQQGLVCREALEWAHFECAVELLRQGCQQDCAERIVLEAFTRNRRQDLVDLMKEDGVGTNVRELVFCTAKRHGHLKDYLGILEEVGAKEKEMADIITTALYSIDVCVILRLLALFASAYRVFKQVLLNTRFFDHDIIVLHTFLMDDHPSLAFYMFTAQEMWENVVGMFADSRLTFRDRRFALRHAEKKGAWNFVQAMVLSPVASNRDRKQVFLQAARQGQWMLALNLSADINALSVSDKLLAFRTWLHTGCWECVPYVLELWEQHDRNTFFLSIVYKANQNLFVKCVLEESIHAGKLDVFKEVCKKTRFEDDDGRLLLETAVKHDKHEFILEFSRLEKQGNYILDAARLAIQQKKWSLLNELITGKNPGDRWWLSDDFDLELLRLCAGGVFQEEDACPVVVPAIDRLCVDLNYYDVLNWELGESFSSPDCVEGIHKLTEWCLRQSIGSAGVVFSVLSDDESCFLRLTDQEKSGGTSGVSSDVWGCCFAIALKRSNWKSAAKCLEEIPHDEVEEIVDSLENEVEFIHLIQRCREEGRFTLALLLSLWTQNWEEVELNLPQCVDTETIDNAVRQACGLDKWDIVRANLDRTSQGSVFLSGILQSAVGEGQSDICSQLMSKVNLLQAPFRIQSLLHSAVTSSGDREQMVKMCIQYGLSTHVNSCDCRSTYVCYSCTYSPMKTALDNGQLPLVKFLYKSGACSERQLFRCKEDSDLRDKLKRQGRDDIVAYLDHVATNPRSLQDLCRLQVSHLISCHPGRADRVMSLDISWPARDLINFEDVLS